jgi:hypothetical protein
MARRYIADHFGLTLETVSRALNALQRIKVIEFQDHEQRHLVIRDKERLQQLASDASDFNYWSVLKNRAATVDTLPEPHGLQ